MVLLLTPLSNYFILFREVDMQNIATFIINSENEKFLTRRLLVFLQQEVHEQYLRTISWHLSLYQYLSKGSETFSFE